MTFSSAPQLLHWTSRTPSGARILGIITLVVNAGMAFGGSRVMHDNFLGGLALTVLGGIGVGAGLALTFGKYSVTVDRVQVTQQWSILLPVRSAVTPLQGFTSVMLVRRVQTASGPGHSGVHYYTTTTVCLSGASGLLNLASSVDDAESEQKAREVAAFLHLPVQDERRSAQEMIAARKQAFVPLVGRALFLGFVSALVLSVLAALFAGSSSSHSTRRRRRR